MKLTDFKGQIKLEDAPKELIKAVQVQLIKVHLYSGAADGISGPKTRAAFAQFKKLEYLEHPDILGASTVAALMQATEIHPTPKDASPSVGGSTVRLPLSGLVAANHLVPGSQHFCWGEFTKGLSRVPESVAVVRNIIRLASYLDAVRDHLGNRTITITSGYRPPAVNRACGGVSNSRHLIGDAVDLTVAGIPPRVVYRRLNSWHGSKGGLGDGATFTHLDLRGYCSRFGYG